MSRFRRMKWSLGLTVAAMMTFWVGSSSAGRVATIVGSYDTPGNARGVTIADNYAYVADYNVGGLQVMDITDPTNPTPVGSYDTPGFAFDVAVAGHYAYVADHTAGGLQILDVTDPANPTFVGSYPTPSYAIGLALEGSHLSVAVGGAGILVFDLSDPASPVVVGSYNTPGTVYSVAVAGNYAYVADGTYGLQVIDITDPTHPAGVGNCNTPDYAEGVTVVGNYAYVADRASGLQIIDIADPSSPALVGSYDTPGEAADVKVMETLAFVADRTSGLQIIDIGDRTNPTLVQSLATPSSAQRLAVAGKYVYVADWTSGLLVVEVNPTLSGVVSVSGLGPLAGVTVGLTKPGEDYETFVTGTDGAFLFEDMPYGLDVELTAVVPLGFHPVDPVDGHCVITVTGDMVQNFTFATVPATGVARGMGYWKNQASKYLSHKGNAEESQEDMETTYPQALFGHFHENALNAIQVEDVTFCMLGTPAAPAPMTLVEMEKTLSASRGKTMLVRAKQHYLTFLLNVASGKVPTYAEVTADHLTASQALQYVAALIQDGNTSNDELAKNISETINEARVVAAGVIPPGFDYIAYARRLGTVDFRVTSNGRPGPRGFQFSTVVPGHVRLSLFDVSGRLVRTLVDEVRNPGFYRVGWDGLGASGARAGSGIYFARLETPTKTLTLKVTQLVR